LKYEDGALQTSKMNVSWGGATTDETFANHESGLPWPC
jgi:hypothetical protein